MHKLSLRSVGVLFGALALLNVVRPHDRRGTMDDILLAKGRSALLLRLDMASRSSRRFEQLRARLCS